MAYCYPYIDTCDSCLELTRSDCDNITIQAGLVSGTQYWLIGIDPTFGNRETSFITIAADGSFVIPVSNKNQFQGEWMFVLSVSDTTIVFVDFTISNVIYNCLLINWTTCC